MLLLCLLLVHVYGIVIQILIINNQVNILIHMEINSWRKSSLFTTLTLMIFNFLYIWQLTNPNCCFILLTTIWQRSWVTCPGLLEFYRLLWLLNFLGGLYWRSSLWFGFRQVVPSRRFRFCVLGVSCFSFINNDYLWLRHLRHRHHLTLRWLSLLSLIEEIVRHHLLLLLLLHSLRIILLGLSHVICSWLIKQKLI